MSFILKLLKVFFSIIWYFIELRTSPSTIKKCCYFTSHPENSAFYLIHFYGAGLAPNAPPLSEKPLLLKNPSCASWVVLIT